jgi:pimeloyl-ACP methyl ester carboxylesterase
MVICVVCVFGRYTWRHQLEALGSTGQYYCVAVDMRGYGESDKPKGKERYLIEEIVVDVASIVKALGYDKVVRTKSSPGPRALVGELSS